MTDNFSPVDAVSVHGEYTAYIFESKQIIAVFVNDTLHDHFRCPEIRDMSIGDRLVIEVVPGFEVRSNGKALRGKRSADRTSFTIDISDKTPDNMELRVCRAAEETVFPEHDNVPPEIQENIPHIPVNLPKPDFKAFSLTAILSLTALALGIAAVGTGLSTVSAGKKAMQTAYEEAKADAEDTIYSEFYDTSFQRAEEKHHVSNDIAVNIEDISETANLEVLEVSDVQYVIREKADNKENITSWLEVAGKGVFTVDLSAAEFNVDSERSFVKVRLPEPVVTCSVDYSGVEQLNFKNDVLNDSVKVGEDMARDDIKKGLDLIKENFNTNTQFTETARNSAQNIITSLIKNANPEIPDINVQVEFYS